MSLSELIQRDLLVIISIVVYHNRINMRLWPFGHYFKLGLTDQAVAILVSSVEIDDVLVSPLGILSKEFIVIAAHPLVT